MAVVVGVFVPGERRTMRGNRGTDMADVDVMCCNEVTMLAY